MITRADVDDARAAAREQWVRFNDAVARGLTGAPLVQIDKKLTRLEREADDLFDAYRAQEQGS